MSRILALFCSTLICTVGIAATPAQLSLARDVMKAMDAEKMFAARMSQIQQMSAPAAQQIMTQHGTTKDELPQIAKTQEKAFCSAMESMRGELRAMELSYAEIYSETELREMKAFFSSPEWQKQSPLRSGLFQFRRSSHVALSWSRPTGDLLLG